MGSRRLAASFRKVALICSALACVFFLACFPLSQTRPWIYYSIYTKRPTLSDLHFEFGWLFETHPYVPRGAYPKSYSGSRSLSADSRARLGPPALEANMARTTLWRFLGVRLTEGEIVPSWGWRDRENLDAAIFIRYRLLSIPLFYAVLLTGAAPAVSLIRQERHIWLARRRAAAGRCTACGYDLRASPAQCPECGARPHTQMR